MSWRKHLVPFLPTAPQPTGKYSVSRNVTGSNQYHCGTKLHKSDGNKHLRTNPKPPQEKQANFNIPINFPPHFGGLPYQIVGRRIPRCFIFLKPCLLGIRKKGGKKQYLGNFELSLNISFPTLPLFTLHLPCTEHHSYF
ncbi:hypothetical protein, variant 1 [Blastomyces dermatitidis ER-3]|uniref:Uncharacterized protein n=1 Tax=Ajellomyces dermatitidis (strain ER-3 / ATCC MYA-2586) TaxID=559297 RepID=A0ABX2VVE4_AJEDR|nr:uncharacterized protein BDCG_16928 [Blastomyces dermatitidis ER-3]XP_045280862.1 hypothetical protein, variant 1 [Blastomyces dermatitidis ER-3]OAT01134.1 hypothetical protein BDCG_16928 [Blastomyces dermatitidis ER-3]OAT01135.1 hypothetical protein, variant 1 [Blastomyces dermatitidis ER-3]